MAFGRNQPSIRLSIRILPIPPTPHHREEEHGGATYFRPIFPWEILEDDEEVLLIAGALL
jgi:hypothetical protein